MRKRGRITSAFKCYCVYIAAFERICVTPGWIFSLQGVSSGTMSSVGVQLLRLEQIQETSNCSMQLPC